MKEYIKGANPYMPLWEHVPDGEPRVFEHNGERRVYVYGSHDTAKTEYCGTDYVVWSAPCTDLTDWRYEGVAFEADNILYAPDVVKHGGKYYMYIAMHRGKEIWVAESDSPAGPFTEPRKTDMGFDIGVLVDDDGRAYAYWGFKKCFAAELNDDMATIKPETLVANMIPHCGFRDNLWDVDNIDDTFSYFEAASIRKVFGKYVFIYSKRDMKGDPERGRKPNMNTYLDYAYSDSPLSGWTYGGTIVANNGQLIDDGNGKRHAYKKSNNHGSIAEIDGKWYVFYHRGTGLHEYARQAMIEPIDAAVDKNGRIYLGSVEYDENGEPISCTEAEMTSQGAHTEGLDAYKIISAGYACYIDPSETEPRPYIIPVYERNNPSSPIVAITDKSVIGFKYLNFGNEPPKRVSVRICGSAARIKVTADAPDGDVIAEICTHDTDDYAVVTADVCSAVTGKHALFLIFETDGECEFDVLSFEK